MKTPEGKRLYDLRKQTPEPVFGTIKSGLGFRQVLLRGIDGACGKRSLVTMAPGRGNLNPQPMPQGPKSPQPEPSSPEAVNQRPKRALTQSRYSSAVWVTRRRRGVHGGDQGGRGRTSVA